MVVVLRATTDVRRASLAGQGVERARAAQELDRSVRRGKPKPRRGATRALKQLDRREGTTGSLDRIEDGTALRRQPRLRGKRERSRGNVTPLDFARGHGTSSLLKTILNLK